MMNLPGKSAPHSMYCTAGTLLRAKGTDDPSTCENPAGPTPGWHGRYPLSGTTPRTNGVTGTSLGTNGVDGPETGENGVDGTMLLAYSPGP